MQAFGEKRIVRARWVLTWKLVPPEEQSEAKADATTNNNTVHNVDGTRKAKARIVLLGYEHPELLDPPKWCWSQPPVPHGLPAQVDTSWHGPRQCLPANSAN